MHREIFTVTFVPKILQFGTNVRYDKLYWVLENQSLLHTTSLFVLFLSLIFKYFIFIMNRVAYNVKTCYTHETVGGCFVENRTMLLLFICPFGFSSFLLSSF